MRLVSNSSRMPLPTLSSGRREGRTVLHIFRDIRSYQRGIDSYLSKLKSARDRTLNLLEELEQAIESTVPKKEVSWNEDDWQSIEEDLVKFGVDPHGTNSGKLSLEAAQISESLQESTNSQKIIPERGSSPDLHCSETFSPLSPLPNGLTYVSGGTMVPLGLENPERPMNCSPELIGKMVELSGGQVIDWKPLV